MKFPEAKDMPRGSHLAASLLIGLGVGSAVVALYAADGQSITHAAPTTVENRAQTNGDSDQAKPDTSSKPNNAEVAAWLVGAGVLSVSGTTLLALARREETY